MGASVTLRWLVSDVECELQIKGPTGHVSLRLDGKIVGSASVASAAAAHEWATRQVDSLGGDPRRDSRTGSG
jgi:hypothetical protein